MPSVKQAVDMFVFGTVHGASGLDGSRCATHVDVVEMLQYMRFCERMATKLAEPGPGSWGEFWRRPYD